MIENALRSAVMLAGVALVTAAGCASKNAATTTDDTTELAQDGADASSTESDIETQATSFVSGSGLGLALASVGALNGGELHLENVGDGAKAFYIPSGCLTVTEEAAAKSVVYAFDDCTGPFGLNHITGSVKVTYQLAAAKLVLDFVGTGIKINRATIDWSAHAEISAKAAGMREMAWTGQFSGTTARGRAFTRTNAKTIDWTIGQSCVTVNGTSDGDVAARKIHTDVISYARCKGECPSAGSEIKITDTAKNKSIDIKFDGGNEATYTAPNGSVTQVALSCGL